MYTKDEEMLFQSAIIYAADAMKTCHNNKPVLVHSLKLANYLYKYGYDMSVVIGALFHDLVEDTDTTLDDIKQKFGSTISELVNLLTMDFKIDDYYQQFVANFERLANNKDAIIIRCVDIMDNARYIKLAPEETQKKVKDKHIYFYNKYKDILQNEPLWNDFKAIISAE